MLVKYYQTEYRLQRCRVHAHNNMLPSIIPQLLEVNPKSFPCLSYGRLGGLPHRLRTVCGAVLLKTHFRICIPSAS